MSWLIELFTVPEENLLIYGSYDPLLVATSVLLAIFTSYMALQNMSLAEHLNQSLKKNLAFATAGISMGGGVWSMHFIGMLAFDLCTPVDYNWGLTFLSMLPSVVACWVAISILRRPSINTLQLFIGGTLVGAGIGTMHYTGMAAMQMAPLLRYDPTYFILSVVFAVVLAVIALWVRFGAKNISWLQLSEFKLNVLCSIILGLAVSGMHYIGMLASRFVATPIYYDLIGSEKNESEMMAVGVAATTVLLTLIVQGVYLVLKYRDMSLAAQANENRVKTIMDTAVDGIVTLDNTGEIIEINYAGCQILDRNRRDILGENISQYMPDIFKPGQSTAILDMIEGSADGIERETLIIQPKGEPLPVRVAIGHSHVEYEDYFVAFISDISKRVSIEKTLVDSEMQFRSLVENIPGAAYRCLNSPEWPMIFISDAVESIVGYPASDFVIPNAKRSISDFYHPEDKDYLINFSSDVPEYTLEYRFIHRDGRVRWVLENGNYIYGEDGKIKWIDGFIMDITDRKFIEQQYIDAKNKAEAAAASRSEFLANMSHEIRTPMNAILGFGEVLSSTELNPEQSSYLQSINNSSKSLLHLLNDILDSSKLDKGKVELEYSTFSIHQKMEVVVSTLWLEAQKKGLELNLQIDNSLNKFYYGVPDRIRQVLTNLIGNAIKFTDQGSVTVKAEQGTEKDTVLFTISDTGIGIPADRLQQIFDPFTQADASMTRKFGGTGLGTTISKQLIELMGGEIWAKSELGKGSTFSFTLPLKSTNQTDSDNQERLQQNENYTDQLPPLNILVADDIQQNRELLKVLLSRHGHTVTVAVDGEQAVNIFKQHTFDLILMDVQMPNMDGHTATRTIRSLEQQNKRARTPVIALTASVREGDKLAAQKAEMDGFAEKPINVNALMSEIKRLCLDCQHSDTNEGQAHSQPSSETIVDTAYALLLWQDQNVFLEQLDKFIHENITIDKTLNTLLLAHDYKSISSTSHSLSGVSGNLAIKAIQVLFSELETNANQELHKECSETIAKIASVFTLLKKERANLKHNEKTEALAQKDVSQEELLAIIEQLQQSASANELNEDSLEKLSTAALHNQRQAVDCIIDAFNEFEFEQAIGLLREFRKNIVQES